MRLDARATGHSEVPAGSSLRSTGSAPAAARAAGCTAGVGSQQPGVAARPVSRPARAARYACFGMPRPRAPEGPPAAPVLPPGPNAPLPGRADAPRRRRAQHRLDRSRVPGAGVHHRSTRQPREAAGQGKRGAVPDARDSQRESSTAAGAAGDGLRTARARSRRVRATLFRHCSIQRRDVTLRSHPCGLSGVPSRGH